nr:MAG TPA: hypothetical protein [Caudoviricetes sp.]
MKSCFLFLCFLNLEYWIFGIWRKSWTKEI